LVNERSLDTPAWIAYIINNIAIYEDFCTFMKEGISNCEMKAADAYLENNERQVSLIVGERQALKELLHMVRMYEQEEAHGRTSTEKH
jgi:hypothetical protein